MVPIELPTHVGGSLDATSTHRRPIMSSTRLIPSTLVAMPPHQTHNLAELERRFNERRQQLAAETRAATLAGRVLARFRAALHLDISPSTEPQVEPPQPTMAWFDGPRRQPRDGRGRFLPKTWLADAELFLPADLAWFHSPINEER
jgi:diadenosine tetraphosphatase ApaH/serine/threonine PP2A family protein phosphatase